MQKNVGWGGYKKGAQMRSLGVVLCAFPMVVVIG